MAVKKKQRGQSIKPLARYSCVCKAWRFSIWSPQFIQKKVNHGNKRMARKKRKREQSIMPELPHDIIIEILLRLHAKSLVRFKPICKAWHTLFTSEQFIRKHLNHAIHDKYNNRHCVLLSSYSCSIQYLHYGALEGNIVERDFLLNYWTKGYLNVVGSCNGLLCVVIVRSAIVVCNPSTREYKKLPEISSVGRGPPTEDLIGFSYDFSMDDYTVVRVRCENGEILMENPAEIYTLKTNSWKEVQFIPDDVDLFCNWEAGTLVNGALYWQVIMTDKIYYINNDAVLRFDSINEKFMVVPLPRDVGEGPRSSVGFPRFSLGAFGGCLCIVQDHHETAVVIWALKEDDSSMEFLWSKLMTIPRMDGMQSNRFLAPICFTKNGEVLMNVRQRSPSGWVSREKEFYLYNPAEEKATFKELLFRDIWGSYWNRETGYIKSLSYWTRETGYIESLISPNGVGTHRSREEEN